MRVNQLALLSTLRHFEKKWDSGTGEITRFISFIENSYNSPDEIQIVCDDQGIEHYVERPEQFIG